MGPLEFQNAEFFSPSHTYAFFNLPSTHLKLTHLTWMLIDIRHCREVGQGQRLPPLHRSRRRQRSGSTRVA